MDYECDSSAEDFDICGDVGAFWTGEGNEIDEVIKNSGELNFDSSSLPLTKSNRKKNPKKGKNASIVDSQPSENLINSESAPDNSDNLVTPTPSVRQTKKRTTKTKQNQPLLTDSSNCSPESSTSVRKSNRQRKQFSVFSVPTAPSNRRSQIGRARRNYVTELADRANVVDSVDLVSSQGLPDVVFINSDDECSPQNNSSSDSLDLSFDSENPEISLKIKWNGKIETFKHRKFQKFLDLMKILAVRENTKWEHIILDLNEQIIGPDDTPDNLNYKIFDFINGRVLSNVAQTKVTQKQDLNMLELRVQSDKWKKPLIINIRKMEKFRTLYIKCSEELKIPCEQIKLSFDGEPLESSETPADLELEGGEVIDCHIK